MELLGALMNLVIVWMLVLVVTIEATSRIMNKEFVRQPKYMVITAGLGVVVNIVLFKVLHHGAGHSHGLMHEPHHHHENHGCCDHKHHHSHQYHAHNHIKGTNKHDMLTHN